jgi:hypothetical protein
VLEALSDIVDEGLSLCEQEPGSLHGAFRRRDRRVGGAASLLGTGRERLRAGEPGRGPAASSLATPRSVPSVDSIPFLRWALEAPAHEKPDEPSAKWGGSGSVALADTFVLFTATPGTVALAAPAWNPAGHEEDRPEPPHVAGVG